MRWVWCVVARATILAALGGTEAPPEHTPTGYKFFDILELPLNATQKEITKQYRTMSRKYHPDKNENKNFAHEKFTEVANAYEVLSNEKERADYKAMGHDGYIKAKATAAGGYGHHDDIWDAFPFSLFGGGRRRGADKAPTIRMRLYVSLEQLYFGDLLHVLFRRPTLCMHIESCTVSRVDCVDSGVRIVNQQIGPGFVVQNQVHDESCIASGKAWKKNCSKCPSGPTEMDKTYISVDIEAGSQSGAYLTFPKVGWQKLNHEPGDLVLEIIQQKHESFVRRGNNLHIDMKLTLLESLTGFSRKIPHISGETVTVEQTEVTAEAENVVIKGRGVPMQGASDMFGDLIVTFQIEFPVKLTNEEQIFCRRGLESVKQWKYTS